MPGSSFLHSRVLFVLARLLVGAVFLLAGAAKALHPDLFYSDLLSFRIPLPDTILRLTAVTLPWLEILVGLALLLRYEIKTFAAVSFGLCVIFILALGQALARHLDIECGCFGSSAPHWLESPPLAFVRAIVLLLLSARIYSPPSRTNFQNY